jgi:hypothetical protein
MDKSIEERLNEILALIELPGEDERRILAYLEQRGFIERVMTRVRLLHSQTRKALLWGGFCLLNLLTLLLFGASDVFLSDFFALQGELSQFFFLFLGLTFLGSLAGLVLSVDTSWLAQARRRGV